MSRLKESMKKVGLKNSDVYFFIWHMSLVAINIAFGFYSLAILWFLLGVVFIINASSQGMLWGIIHEQDDLLGKAMKQNGELWAIVQKYEATAKSSTPATAKSKAGKPQTKK